MLLSYSCFISYSTKDQEFAERLHADLQARKVRVWFAPEDLKIGDVFRQSIDQAIRLHDKLLVVRSEHSVASDWVQTEVEAAFERERFAGEHAVEHLEGLDETGGAHLRWLVGEAEGAQLLFDRAPAEAELEAALADGATAIVTPSGSCAGSRLLYTSPSPRDRTRARMPSSACDNTKARNEKDRNAKRSSRAPSVLLA